jgi:hypothetical protein
MVLLGYKAQLEDYFGPFGDSANPNARQVHGVNETYHRLGNHFGRTRWKYDVMWVMWNLISVRLDAR